ncbi:quinone oxidoreductase-like protein 2 homolog [Pseudomyrmex gracilis]|uniref:quinone oxidoreductase-like protein 2 homolog n=1 Tax=Pseudomyrmex gracilis TaxID=219809 RepID=UPI00099552A7|nr:quinone oxidoreductase-like protein 2 homolog [Pseudomyrmex gracilis]
MRRVCAKNAAAVTDDYFSALLTMGRRARLQTGEYFLINAERSSSALAVIDLAAGVFGAKPIAVCSDARQAKLYTDLGAAVIRNGNRQRLPCEVKEISGKEEVRVIIDTENGSSFRSIIECLETDGLVAFLGSARNRRCSKFYPALSNYTVFAVSAEHYKVADTLVYRETIEHLLDYQSECAIRPRISAIFGLHRINDAFEYCTTLPSGKVLIDMKDRDRLTIFDVCDNNGL